MFPRSKDFEDLKFSDAYYLSGAEGSALGVISRVEEHNVDPEFPHLHPESGRVALECRLGRRVHGQHGERAVRAEADHVHDPRVFPLPEQGQEGLGHDVGPDHVDFELAPDQVHGLPLNLAEGQDGGVVDQAGQLGAALGQLLLDNGPCGLDGALVRYVQVHDGDPAVRKVPETVGADSGAAGVVAACKKRR